MDKIRSIQFPEGLLNSFYSGLIKIVGIILFVFAAWAIIKGVLYIVGKSLKLSKADVWFNKLQTSLNLPLKIDFSKMVLGFLAWTLVLLAIMIGADILELTIISTEMGKIIAYLPKLVSGLLLFIAGLYVASVAHRSLSYMVSSLNLSGSKILGRIAYVLILLFFSLMALNQMGINTDIINNNILLITGAFILTLAIAIGLGSRDIVFRLLLGFYTRRNFEIGKRIRIDSSEGVIVAIDNICMTVEADGQKTVYPIKMVSNKKISILD